MKKSACLLALAAGAAFAGVASAQAIAPDEFIPLDIQSVRTIVAPGVSLPGYGQRLTTNVFQYAQGGPFGYFAAIAGAYNDLRYSALLGTNPSVNLQQLELFGVLTANNVDSGCQIVVEIYDTHTAGVFPPYTELLHTQTYTFAEGSFPLANAAAQGYDIVVGGWPVINTGDNNVGIFVQFRSLDGTTIHSNLRPVHVNTTAPDIGTSLAAAYLDIDSDGAITAADGGPYVATGNTDLHCAFTLVGDVPVDPPTDVIDLGTLGLCTPSTTSVSLAAGEVKWYTITVPAGGVDAAELEALTIDTETPGSVDDSVLGLYSETGNLLLVEDDDGSGALSQISFGVGRWAGPGDGLPYDGRNGDLPAGTYYLAVTSFGDGLFFDEGFGVTPGASAAATYDLNINYYEQSCLPTLLAPTPDVDLGQILAPSQFPGGLDLTTGLRWYKFNVCTEISDPNKFLDFDFSPSSGDLVAIIFDANGNEVAFSDDADADPDDTLDYFLPQFSFGNVGPRLAGGQGIGSIGLEGQDGTLPAGDYYMAVGGFPYAALPEAVSTTNGRFYFFGSALEADVSSPFIATDVTSDDCDPVSTCPACPADYDQDGGVTGGDLARVLRRLRIRARPAPTSIRTAASPVATLPRSSSSSSRAAAKPSPRDAALSRVPLFNASTGPRAQRSGPFALRVVPSMACAEAALLALLRSLPHTLVPYGTALQSRHHFRHPFRRRRQVVAHAHPHHA
jgi:hypothetical protein